MRNTQSNLYLMMKDKLFHLSSGIRLGCPLSPFLFSIVLEALSKVIRKKKKCQNWEGRSKTIFIHRLHDLTYRKS